MEMKGALTCNHDVYTILTNGAKHCQGCDKIITPRQLLQSYQGKAYQGKVEVKDGRLAYLEKEVERLRMENLKYWHQIERDMEKMRELEGDIELLQKLREGKHGTNS